MKPLIIKKTIVSLLMVLSVTALISCHKTGDVNPEPEPDPTNPPPATKPVTLPYEDNFDDNKGTFSPGVSGNARTSIRNGHLILEEEWIGEITNYVAANHKYFAETDKKQSVEIRVKQTSGRAEDIIGLLINFVDGSNYLGFEVQPSNKKARVFKSVSDKITNYLDWNTSELIKSTPAEYNTLKVTIENEKLHFYINDQLLHEIPVGTVKVLDKISLEAVKNFQDSKSYKSTFEIDNYKVAK